MEEVGIGGDTFESEHLAENACDHHLQLRPRLPVRGGGAEVDRGQRLSIDLARCGEPEFVHHDECVRHHVTRKSRGGVLEHVRRICGRARGQRRIRHQHVVTIGRGHAEAYRVGDERMVDDRGLHLPRFDTQATDLELEVGASDVAQIATHGTDHAIAGAIHALAGSVWVGDEPRRRQVAAAMVAASELDATQIQLAGYARGDRPQRAVEHDRTDTGDRQTDRHLVVLGHRSGGGGPDADLRWPVQVVESTPGPRPASHQVGWACLPDADDPTQLRHGRRLDGAQRRWGHHRVRHALVPHQGGELVAAEHPGRADDESGALSERHQDLEDRRVETR